MKKFSKNIQRVERLVRQTYNACQIVVEWERRYGYLRVSAESRTLMPMFYSKRVFKTDIVNEYICILFSDNEACKDVNEGSSPVKSQQGAYPYE